ncbi:DUF6531 domain-containing protein, partial [Streptomyces palmae]
MTSRDAIDGGGPDRIPPHAKPSDVIPGDPSVIDELVNKLLAYAGAFGDGNDKLTDLSLLNWTGAGSEGFKTATSKLPLELENAQTYFKAAASALDSYADKLRSLHTRVKPLIEDADAARAASQKYWSDVTAYNEAVDRKDDPLPKRPPDADPGNAALIACYGRLDKLEAELALVVTASKNAIDTAAKKAPVKPPGAKGFDKVKKGLGDFFSGAGDSVWGMYKDFESLVKDGPDGALLHLAAIADGAAYAAEHPKEFAKAVLNWEEWQRNPARAAGQLTPDLLLALASGGSGALRRGATTAERAARRLLDRERALSRDGKGRDHVDSDPKKTCTPGSERCTTGEPIDVATGEMVMSATDVTLPGALPLVLERHYASGHPCGGWFGRTWAGTLDQRLEIDDAGVVYITDDGMLLSYPVPRPGVPTMPTHGPRWPLCWDGKPGGTFSITIPEQGRALHFAPLPVGGRELALQAITDRTGEGDRIEVHYDAQGAPTGITHSGGYRIAVDTDPALLRITALRLLHGEDHQHSTTLVSFGYDGAGDLTEVVNSTGKELRYRYDEKHRMTSWSDRNGTTYAYVYDHRGRVLRGIGPEGILSGRFHYDTAARTTRYTDSLGNTSTYVLNEAYKVVAATDPLGNTTRTEWDEDNRRPVAVTDPLGNTTRYRHDEQGRLIAVERPDGTVTEAVYDEQGLPVEIREPGGAIWRYDYDERGARTSTTDPTGATTRYAYNASGHLTAVVDPLGNTTEITPDATGLPVAITDALGHTTHVHRGPHGQITAVTDPLGHTTRHGWTIEGRPAWREAPDGTRETWQWDTEGNLALYTDAAGHTTTHTHTHFDLPATRTDPDGARYAFTYDTELRLIAVTNPQERRWTYEYDAAGRLVAETDFNGARRGYERDPAGRLIAQTNALGETLRYTRDAMGRVVTQHDESSGEVTTYAYDTGGALARAVNADSELTLERDPLGRITAETVNGRATTYAYDAVGNRTHRTTPSGLTSIWAYGPTGLPSTLSTAGHTLAFEYDAEGRETRRAIGAVTLTQSWSARGLLTAQSVTADTEDRLLQHRSYTHRPDGYVTQIRELSTGTRGFSLDPMGRVTGVRAHGWTEAYAYDSAGNQTHAAAPGHEAPAERAYEGTLIRQAGRTTYEHDGAGRLVRRTRKRLDGTTATWVYHWNTQNRLTRAITPRGEEWTYTYDALGRRISKAGPDRTSTTFTWDGSHLVEQTTDRGATSTWDYAPGTHSPVTQTDQELGSTRCHAVVTDQAGTPTELVTPDGTLVWQHRTTLWGTPLPAPADAVS